MSTLFSLRLLTFVAILSVATLACAADKIALTCSGTMRSKNTQPPFVEISVPSETLVIDLDRELVTGSMMGSFLITKVTDKKIDFEGTTQDHQMMSYGGVDRYSGMTVMTGYRGKEMVITYNLTCRRANPLF